MKKLRWLIIIVVICLVENDLQAQNKISYIMDMVHHNPGEPLYESKYCRPDVLKDMGYNARCFFCLIHQRWLLIGTCLINAFCQRDLLNVNG